MRLVCVKCCIPLLLIALIPFSLTLSAKEDITSPEAHFGFKPGSDRKLAHWKDIVSYFTILQQQSDRIRVMQMGKSTMGNPFLVVIISSPENLSDLDRYQKINKAISDPRGVAPSVLESHISAGKAVICQSFGLHSSEVGGPQSVPALSYDLLTQNDEETKRILDEVLFFMIPDFNPDGSIMIHDWYQSTLGTATEGADMPWLYHKYIGHDTNRDGDFLNMVESRYAASIIYRDWPPQAYLDHHQMGSYGPRFFVPPYCEPIRPHADPLIWREISWYGSHIAYKLEEHKIKGVINSAMFPGWGHFGWHWITPFHNIAGMLTESASALLATPLFIHPDQLRAESRGFPEYTAQSTFPSPWEGGWWRLENIVRQKQIAARALLDLAARNRKTILRNAVQKALRQTERGAHGEVTGIVIPSVQHDPLTARKMINILMRSGIEIRTTKDEFRVGDTIYPADSFFITLAQPKMGLIRNLLMETRYADNTWTRDADGTPLRPYDLSTHTMHEFMGIRADPVKLQSSEGFTILSKELQLTGRVHMPAKAYCLDGRQNLAFLAINRLLDQGIAVERVTASSEQLKAGDFIIRQGDPTLLSAVAEETGVDFEALPESPGLGTKSVKRKRLGIYQRYLGGNMDEGWTRFLLERFAFPFQSLRDEPFDRGRLNQDFDVILLADDSPEMITGKLSERQKRYISDAVPEKYRSGISEKGIRNLVEFVSSGGTLVSLGNASTFAINEFKLQVRNVLDGLDRNQFFCSGSTLKTAVDISDPLAWGMPKHALVLFTSNPVFSITPGRRNDDYKTIVRYPTENILKSGWLLGEKAMAGKAAMVRVRYGRGTIVLIGFRPQHRAQTAGTFKFLFNTLLE